MKFYTPSIFGSSSSGRNEAANACTPTIGIKEAYQSARELPVPQKKRLRNAFKDRWKLIRTNYAGMSVVGIRAPSGYLFVLVKAIGQR